MVSRNCQLDEDGYERECKGEEIQKGTDAQRAASIGETGQWLFFPLNFTLI
jgi:hypothetical protein